ncbi:hypothetical protein K469DRAFT_682935 [Zopfia rhizophila CBS 207.26]|uniref:Uncharacterized protein n=1 Tax=Zopfia rhizophila CBS 207.26 TaxID=1314779 RepID=A0A6A6ECL6_9PEZI|nr:hypothetical protein K469DRAFT_682935 [Zopfia rhizophila CBS 207.26]
MGQDRLTAASPLFDGLLCRDFVEIVNSPNLRRIRIHRGVAEGSGRLAYSMSERGNTRLSSYMLCSALPKRHRQLFSACSGCSTVGSAMWRSCELISATRNLRSSLHDYGRIRHDMRLPPLGKYTYRRRAANKTEFMDFGRSGSNRRSSSSSHIRKEASIRAVAAEQVAIGLQACRHGQSSMGPLLVGRTRCGVIDVETLMASGRGLLLVQQKPGSARGAMVDGSPPTQWFVVDSFRGCSAAPALEAVKGPRVPGRAGAFWAPGARMTSVVRRSGPVSGSHIFAIWCRPCYCQPYSLLLGREPGDQKENAPRMQSFSPDSELSPAIGMPAISTLSRPA